MKLLKSQTAHELKGMFLASVLAVIGIISFATGLWILRQIFLG